MARIPFKLRSQGSSFKQVGSSTPKTEINLRGIVDRVKGSLSRMDKNLQERAAKHSEWKKERKEKIAEKAAASPDGLTNFQRHMADKKAQRESGGKSKYQRDIIKRRADRKAEKAMVPIYEGEPDYEQIIQSETKYMPIRNRGFFPIYEGESGYKPIIQSGATGLSDAEKLAAKTEMAEQEAAYNKMIAEEKGSPHDKKSPTKKRRGYKMKSSPAKIYDTKRKRRKNYKY